MNFVYSLKRFIAAHAGKLSIFLAFFSASLLPILICEYLGKPVRKQYLIDIYLKKIKDPLALVKGWMENDILHFQHDYMVIVFAFMEQLGADVKIAFYCLIVGALIFSCIAFTSKQKRVGAMIGGGLSAVVLILYLSLNAPMSFYNSVEERKTHLQRLLSILEDKEKSGKFDSSYQGVALDIGNIYASDEEHGSVRKAKKFYLKAAELDHPVAQFKLGAMYLEGFWKSEKKAKKWLLKSIDNESAQTFLTYSSVGAVEEKYEIGTLFPEVGEVLFQFLLVEELRRHKMSDRCAIASFYKEGKGVEQNYELAYLWAALAAEDTVNFGEVNVRIAPTVKKCNKLFADIKALLPLEKITELNKRKKSFLEQNLLNGQARVKKSNDKIHADLLARARNENNSDKYLLARYQWSLSNGYTYGSYGTTQDQTEALKWLKKSVANFPFPENTYDLALRYKSGIGVEQDVEQAYYWAVLANETFDTGKYGKWQEEKYQRLQNELIETISKDIAKEVASKAAKLLNQKYPDFYRNGQKIRNVTFLSDIKREEEKKRKPAIERRKKDNLINRKYTNERVVFAEEGSYPVEYFGKAANENMRNVKHRYMFTWVDNDRVIYRDNVYVAETQRVEKYAYGLILIDFRTGKVSRLTDVSNAGFFAFDTQKQQLYYYKRFGNGQILKHAILDGDKLIELETTIETSKNYHKFKDRGQRQNRQIKNGRRLTLCKYFEDPYQDLEKDSREVAHRYLCTQKAASKRITILKKDVVAMQISLDGCRAFGIIGEKSDNAGDRFVVDLCKE